MVIENDYMTIEEVYQYDSKFDKLKQKLASFQISVLQVTD